MASLTAVGPNRSERGMSEVRLLLEWTQHRVMPWCGNVG